MTSILKTELFRLNKSKTFWLCLALCVVLPFLSLLLLLFLNMLMRLLGYGNQLWEALQSQGGALSLVSSYGSIRTDSNLLAVICVSVFLCGEFGQGTIRNMVVAGKKRSEIYWAFFIVSLIIGITYLMVEFTVSLIVFGCAIGFGDVLSARLFTNILCFFAMGVTSAVCAQTLVCMFMFGTKKTSMTLLFSLLICLLVPYIVTLIMESVVTAAAQVAAIPATTLYLIPFYNCSIVDPVEPSGLNMGIVMLYNFAMSVIFWAAGYFPFKKADLK